MTTSKTELDIGAFKQPGIVYAIGDSHVLSFKDLHIECKEYDQQIAFKVMQSRGIHAGNFTDDSGAIHNNVVQAFAATGLLSSQGMPTHLLTEPYLFKASLASFTAVPVPTVLLSYGCVTNRNIFMKELNGEYDFIVPDTPYSTAPDTDIIPLKQVEKRISELLQPLYRGLILLKKIYIGRILIMGLVPPTTDKDLYKSSKPYNWHTDTLYKAVIMFNRELDRMCSELKLIFIDTWPGIIDETGYKDPRYELDGVHVNRAGTLKLAGKIAYHALDMTTRTTNRSRHTVYQELCKADFRKLPVNIADDTRVSLVSDYEKHGVCITRISDQEVSKLKSHLKFGMDISNRKPRLDWGGYKLEVSEKFYKTTSPVTPNFLKDFFEIMYSEHIDGLARELGRSDVMYYNVRPVRTAPYTDPQYGPFTDFHRDGAPPGVFRAIIYLTDVDNKSGPFEYERPDGTMETVTGPAGTLFFFDAARILHTGRSPEDEPRDALDIVIGLRRSGMKQLAIHASNNHWPADPYVFSVEGLITHPPMQKDQVLVRPE